MPGEWLPENDKGYLRGVYTHADSIGAGVGGRSAAPPPGATETQR